MLNNQHRTTLEALQKSVGRISVAVKMAGIARSTYYKWRQEDAEYAKAVDDLLQDCTDMVEDRLFDLITGTTIEVETAKGTFRKRILPNLGAIKFYLERRAADRGYGKSPQLNSAKLPPVPAIAQYTITTQGPMPEVIVHRAETEDSKNNNSTS